MSDPVEHPEHYTWLKKAIGVEVYQITQLMNFNLGNSLKYVLRAGRKSTDKIQDLKKARQYLDFEITRLEGETPVSVIPKVNYVVAARAEIETESEARMRKRWEKLGFLQ